LKDDRQPASPKKNLYLSQFSSSKSIQTTNFDGPLKTKDLLRLYNMERSICMNCVKTKNKKYQTNKFIPCISFSSSK